MPSVLAEQPPVGQPDPMTLLRWANRRLSLVLLTLAEPRMAREIAAEWKQAVIAKGFIEIPGEAPTGD
jgi:hypothetical protein